MILAVFKTEAGEVNNKMKLLYWHLLQQPVATNDSFFLISTNIPWTEVILNLVMKTTLFPNCQANMVQK